ncbi:hypothetical protein DFH08DRAFT_942605, partial [Mycena albidolilacea]
MEILSMITKSKHSFLSYYYFAWGHSILITLPAGNVSRLDSRVKKVGYSVSFAASRFSFVVLASSFTVLELQTWAAGLRFLSEQVLRTENSSSFFKMRDIVRDPMLHLLFDGRRSRGECGPLRRMNQSRCGGGVLALELEADIKAPAFETSAVHTIVAAFVHVVKGAGLWADVSWVYDLPKRPQTLPNVYIGHRDIRADCERPMFYVGLYAALGMFGVVLQLTSAVLQYT